MFDHRRTRRGRIGATTVVALALATAACDTGTGPEVAEPLDTDAALADFDAVAATFDSDGWSGFQALSGSTPFGSSPAGIEAVAALPTNGGESRRFASRLAEALTRHAAGPDDGPARGPIISGWHRGTTFVYDPDTDEYVADLEREGAPETGVRFILYGTDAEGYPVVTDERGHADLIDEGDGSAEDIVLRLHVVYDERDILDYRTTLDHDATSGALTVAGFVAGPIHQLDFDVSVAAREDQGVTRLDVDFEMGVAGRGFSVVGSVRGMEDGGDDGSGSVDITVRHRSRSLRVDVTGEGGTLDGSILLDERLFATVSGPADDPVFLGADGEPLRPGEVLVLLRVVDAVEDVFDLLEDLIDPVDELVLLGFIL